MSAYDAAVAVGTIRNSQLQREVVAALAEVTTALLASKKHWYWPFPVRTPQGLYLYGPVGAGKTYLMDLFYQHYPGRDKRRFHFHQFMQWVDAELRRLQGVHDPLRSVVNRLVAETRVLCLDEFLVHDVAHAMILADLLKGLLQQGVVLIATANTAPHDLYRGGVHRERFLPAIALIQQNCRVMKLDEQGDYRLGREHSEVAYFYPLTVATRRAMTQTFAALTEHLPQQARQLTIQNRPIEALCCAGRVVWFEFNVLCNMPRSQLDYLELASLFDVLLLSDIPALDPEDITRVVLLIRLVDVLYDCNVHLVISAAVPVEGLYEKGPMSGEFKRTLSRLQEMQSEDYRRRHRRR